MPKITGLYFIKYIRFSVILKVSRYIFCRPEDYNSLVCHWM